MAHMVMAAVITAVIMAVTTIIHMAMLGYLLVGRCTGLGIIRGQVIILILIIPILRWLPSLHRLLFISNKEMLIIILLIIGGITVAIRLVIILTFSNVQLRGRELLQVHNIKGSRIMKAAKTFLALSPMLLLGACVSVPTGPSVLALPGDGKNFDQFRADDFVCRQFASNQIGGKQGSQVATESGVTSAAVGTVLGAAAGAAINGGSGAAVGAGTGLALGGLAGSGAAETSRLSLQQQYDMGYVQCMYAKGNRVPVSSSMASSFSQQPHNFPPPPSGAIAP
jgi:hypothetical protein